MNDFINTIKLAVKRAQFFSQNIQWGGSFSPIGREGLSIPVRNGMWFIDLKENITQEDYSCELFAIWWMARSINKWIDGNFVDNNEEAKWALAAFLSRALRWGDWSKLE